MSSSDNRSVGELLLEADAASRRLLLTAPYPDPGAVARTFGEVVEAAADLWQSLPQQAFRRRDIMDALSASSNRIHSTQIDGGWPGPGPDAPELTHIGDQFARAADLVRRHGGHVQLDGGPVEADVTATKTRTAHVLYVTAHAVALSLRRGITHADHTDGATTDALRVMRATLVRLETFERTAGEYALPGRRSTAAGEVVPPARDLLRLEDALTEWHLQAHRSLQRQPTAGGVVEICRTQADLHTATAIIVHAAEVDGALRRPDARRLRDAVEEGHAAWATAAARWAELLDRVPARNPTLAGADAELHAAIRQITHNGTTWATPDVIASRIDLDVAARDLARAVAHEPDLAQSITAAADHPRLTAPARTVTEHLAFADSNPTSRGTRPSSSETALISPRDLQANRPVPLPQAMREHLREAGQELGAAVTRCASAALQVEQPPPRPTYRHAPRRANIPPPRLSPKLSGRPLPAR